MCICVFVQIISHLGAAPCPLSADGEMEHAGVALEPVVSGVDVKGNFPFLGHARNRSKQSVLGNFMLALQRESCGPFPILCLPKTKKNEDVAQEPRDEEERLHAVGQAQKGTRSSTISTKSDISGNESIPLNNSVLLNIFVCF